VSPAVERFLRCHADRIRRQCVASIIEIRKAVPLARHYLSGAKFQAWIETEIGLSARSAQKHMRAAK